MLLRRAIFLPPAKGAIGDVGRCVSHLRESIEALPRRLRWAGVNRSLFAGGNQEDPARIGHQQRLGVLGSVAECEVVGAVGDRETRSSRVVEAVDRDELRLRPVPDVTDVERVVHHGQTLDIDRLGAVVQGATYRSSRGQSVDHTTITGLFAVQYSPALTSRARPDDDMIRLSLIVNATLCVANAMDGSRPAKRSDVAIASAPDSARRTRGIGPEPLSAIGRSPERTRWVSSMTIRAGVGEITATPATKLWSRRSTAARRAPRRRSIDASRVHDLRIRNPPITAMPMLSLPACPTNSTTVSSVGSFGCTRSASRSCMASSAQRPSGSRSCESWRAGRLPSRKEPEPAGLLSKLGPIFRRVPATR